MDRYSPADVSDFIPAVSLTFKLTHNVTMGQNLELWPKPAYVCLNDCQSPFACGASSLGVFGSVYRNAFLKKPFS